jgi:hypothetical protein
VHLQPSRLETAGCRSGAVGWFRQLTNFNLPWKGRSTRLNAFSANANGVHKGR